MKIKGKYIFTIPVLWDSTYQVDKIYTDKGTKPWHHAPYRNTGVHVNEWKALKLRRMLAKAKIPFKWHEKNHFDYIKITIRFNYETTDMV